MTTARGLTRRGSLGLLGALATPWLARAQSDYPSRPTKLIVPYAAGGSSDVVARFIAERMRDKLGQSIVIETGQARGRSSDRNSSQSRYPTVTRCFSAVYPPTR